MIRKLLVVAAAVAMPVSIVAVSGGIAGAVKPPSAATDTAVCTGITGTVHFSIPLTNAGVTSGAEVTTLSGTLSGCTASGAFPVTLSGGSFSATLTGKAASAKHPAATCGGLAGATKESGTLTTTWAGSSPAVPATTTKLKTATGGISGAVASFTVQGKYSGSFGGADKGKSSATNARTTETIASILTSCAGSGVSVLHLQGPATGNPLVLG